MSLKVSGTKGYKLLVNDDHHAELRAAYAGRDAGVPGRQSKASPLPTEGGSRFIALSSLSWRRSTSEEEVQKSIVCNLQKALAQHADGGLTGSVETRELFDQP